MMVGKLTTLVPLEAFKLVYAWLEGRGAFSSYSAVRVLKIAYAKAYILYEGPLYGIVAVKMSKFIRSSNETRNVSLCLLTLEMGYQSVVCKVE